MAIREKIKKDKMVWEVDVTSRELNARERKTFSDLATAQKYEADVRFAFSKGKALPQESQYSDVVTTTKGYTLEKAFYDCYNDEWIGKASEAKNLQKGKNLMTYFGKNEPISNITRTKIKQWIRDMKSGVWKRIVNPGQKGQQNLSNSTINRNLSHLSKILRYAYMDEKLDRMPSIKKEKEDDNRISYFTEGQEKAMVDLLRKRAAQGNDSLDVLHAFIVSIDTGLRASELRRLKKKDIKKMNGDQVLYIGETKNDLARYVPLYSRTQRILEIRCKTIEGDYLFPYPENWYRHTFERVMDQLGIEGLRWHDLRHTCATRLVNWGTDLGRVQKWLGHKRIQTTLIYAHYDVRSLQETASLLNAKVDALDDAMA